MVTNVHERSFHAPLSSVGELIDQLASRDDLFWPQDRWPPMRFSGPLGVGASGGHGPIRYSVEAYKPGRSIRFRFTAPGGFLGTHGFEAREIATGVVQLRHTLAMKVRGGARLSWPLVFRPLHDALIEDALDRAEAHCTHRPVELRRWPSRVRWLRWLMSRAQRRIMGGANKARQSIAT